MPSSDDINNLFARFGGRPENYHEIERADEARESESRWPLLSALNSRGARPAASGAQQRTEPSLGLPPTMSDPTRAEAVQAAAAAPAAVPATPGRWPDGPAARASAPAAQASAAAAPAATEPDSRFQFIAPRPRGGAHPGHVRPSPPDTLAEAARLAVATPVPAQPFMPFGASVPAGPGGAPAAPHAESAVAQRAPAPADTPFAAFRSAPPTPPAAEPPAGSAGQGSLAGVFQRLSQPSNHPPEPEPRGIFQRLVNR
ncbi:hypothetical protein FOZ76_05380 [Verticiella sediminum]|uniref:Cellulose biosynthesis protein BcsR n=1 Tax=Verticiella sediminum TaxID=1247510 RepID=A0A556AXE8_9BURK|nr:cellulose biosynthesis protein BcsP [Verticiella sediminum]TSH97586.1 hypothetical protein FOZ76_05380 [Verticiella sediminum]